MASREWEIDTQLRDLVAKIVQGDQTPQEYAEYQHLTAERARLMRPRLPRQRPGLCSRLQRRLSSFS
jgi:hypothetical protein